MVGFCGFLRHGCPLVALSGFALLLQALPARGHEGYHELLELQTRAVENSPSDPVARFELASSHAQHGDLALALQDLDRVDELAPGKYLTDFVRGQAYSVAHDFAHAKDALDRHLAAHPESAPAWSLRARAERELGESDASLADYREALKRTSAPEPDLVQEVAGALADAGNKTEAAEVLATAIARLGPIPSLVLRDIELETETKNFDAALRRVEQARHAAPRPEPWMARRATILAQANRVAESYAAWKELIAHLDALPERERNASAMIAFRAQATQALAAR